MAFAFYDRVKETSTTNGTGTLTLAGAVAGFRSFTSVFSNGDTMYYCITDQNGTNWEVGFGTFTTSGTTLARTTVIASSNSNSAVNFTSSALFVFNVIAARAVSPNTYSATPSNPTGTTSGTGVMMGLAGALTPKSSGLCFFAIGGTVSNSAGGGAFGSINYGTGGAPTNGAAATGTGVTGSSFTWTGSLAAQDVPFGIFGMAQLTPGTTYWFDMDLGRASAAGTASVLNLGMNAFEL